MEHALWFASILFGIGIMGCLIHRNVLIVLMSIELMLNAANLLFAYFARVHQDAGGLVFVVLIITVAAAEAAVGLALVISLFKNKGSVNLDEITELAG